MLSKVPGSAIWLLMSGLCLLAIICFVCAVGYLIYYMVKKSDRHSNAVILTSLILVVIAAVSWILNAGWLRVFLTVVGAPFLHSIVFIVMSVFASKHARDSRRIRIASIVYQLTYILSYLCFPDGGDIGGMYFFFGLIHNDVLVSTAFFICIMSLISHFIVFINLIVQMFMRGKNRFSRENIPPPPDNHG